MDSELTRFKGRRAEKEGNKLLVVEGLLCARHHAKVFHISYSINAHNSLWKGSLLNYR